MIQLRKRKKDRFLAVRVDSQLYKEIKAQKWERGVLSDIFREALLKYLNPKKPKF